MMSLHKYYTSHAGSCEQKKQPDHRALFIHPRNTWIVLLASPTALPNLLSFKRADHITYLGDLPFASKAAINLLIMHLGVISSTNSNM